VIDGIAVIDKPSGMTSHDVVARVRKVLGTRKVGHAGTLDPLATGILVLGVGRATRLLGFLANSDKTYRTTIRLGITTSTDDADGVVTSHAPDVSHVTAECIAAEVARLTGPIEQVPSSVSAIKVGGRRAHALARAGQEVTLAARPVTISQFDIHKTAEAEVSGVEPGKLPGSTPDTSASAVLVVDVVATVQCSAGTYIRALARDLGAQLGVGGHVLALRREKSGQFDHGQSLDAFERSPEIMPMGEAIRGAMPMITVNDVDAVRHGRVLTGDIDGDLAALVNPQGELLAIVEPDNGRMRYRAVFVGPGDQ